MDQSEAAGDEPFRREIRTELPLLATAVDQAQDTGDGGHKEPVAGFPAELLGGGLSDGVIAAQRTPAHVQCAI